MVRHLREVRDPRWHRCRKWWQAALVCPYHPNPEESDGPDDEDEEKDPVEVPVPIPIKKPDEKKVDEVTVEAVKEAEEIVTHVFKVIEILTKDTPTPIGRRIADPVSVPTKATAPKLNVGRTNPNRSRRNIRQARSALKKSKAVHKVSTKASASVTQPAASTSGSITSKGAETWVRGIPLLAAASALAVSLGGASGGSSPPPTAGAEIGSAGIAESAIVKRLTELQPSGGARRREQRGAVEEAERIVRAPKQPPVPTRSGINVTPSRAHDTGISTTRIAIAVGIGVGAVVIGGAILAGGRGGGFHRPSNLKPGLIARAY